MLLAIDVGNTNTVLGLFDGSKLIANWRIATEERRTRDEYAVLLRQLLALNGHGDTKIAEAIIATVVPSVSSSLRDYCVDYLGCAPVVVGPGTKTGMPILYENPREVGADRIVNAVAAFERFQQGVVVVDFGTATTWDVITPKGEYLGGIIAPGVDVSAEALFHSASKLPRVDVSRPAELVGRNTVQSIQSGLFFGYGGMVDALVARIRDDVAFDVVCVATGGLATLIAGATKNIDHIDDHLTLRGLRLISERNRSN